VEFQDYENFVNNNNKRGIITTYRRNGAGHISIVVVGAYQGKAAYVIVHGTSVKVRNLQRDNRCTVTAVSEGWRSCVSVEGTATLMDYRNTDAETMRVELREVYRACSAHGDHPDWEEYDQAMVEQDGVIVLVEPERVYGFVRG
jgi:PPOX class probable F420-dependent enzyme